MKVAVTAILFAILSPVFPEANAGVCKYPTPVEVFAGSFYSIMMVFHDPNILNTPLDGGEAGMMLFKVVKQCLEKHHQCNADSVAYTFGQAVTRVGTLTPPILFKHVAYTVGRELFEYGLLDCSNAVDLSLEYFYLGHNEVADLLNDGQHPSDFEKFFYGIAYSTVDLYLAYGLNIEDTAQETANKLYHSFDDDVPICKIKKS